jgi:hypothetical protein
MQKWNKVIFIVLIPLLLAGCRSVSIAEKMLIREREKNNSFSIYGFGRQDTLWGSMYYLDTMLKNGHLYSTFNTDTKIFSVDYTAKSDTLRDTTYIKTDTITEKIVPRWAWVLIGALSGACLICVILYRFKKNTH